MSTPLVSVIVPSYNYAEYLPLRIDSILKQSFSDFELILLDDASSDGSAELLRKYQQTDSRISTVIVNKQNSGSPFKQWKKGLELARGKYVWIAEGDDYAKTNFLEVTVLLLEQYDEAAYCFTGSHLVDERGCLLARDMDQWTSRQQNNPSGFKSFPGKKYVSKNMYWKNYVYNASGVLFRRETALKLTDEWVSMRYCGDWWFWTFMALHGDVIEVYERLNYFRQHSGSVTVGSKQSDEAYAACMMECMNLTWNVEQRCSFSVYKRWLCYGNYYKQFKRKKLDASVRQRLFSEVERRCSMVRAAYCLAKVNKFFSGLFPCLNRMKSERLN